MIDENDFTTMESRILEKLSKVFNDKIKEFFAKEFDGKLESMVEWKLGDLLNQSSQNVSILDQTIHKNDQEARVLALEDRVNEKSDRVESLLKELKAEKERNCALVEENNRLLAKTEDSCQAQKEKNILLEKKIDTCFVQLDNQQQYTRNDILELLGIPYPRSSQYPEDVMQVVKDFFQYYLNITVHTYDISVAHRQTNPEEKKRLGKNYIPPIYVKVVNRHLALHILKKRYLLRNCRNRYGDKFEIRENLTLTRRLLWASVQEKLNTYRFKWVKNGQIFVKKTHNSYPIKIASEDS